MIANCFYSTVRDANLWKARNTLKLGNPSRFHMTTLHVAGEEASWVRRGAQRVAAVERSGCALTVGLTARKLWIALQIGSPPSGLWNLA